MGVVQLEKPRALSAGAALCVLLGGCSQGGEPYARLHDAALTADGAAIVMLVESGDSRTEGSLFSGVTIYSPRKLALWRLERARGALSESDDLALPKGFVPFNGHPQLSQFAASAKPLQASLPDCQAALTLCAIRRTPEPYVVEDLAGGVLRGLVVIDPGSGRLVRARGAGLTSADWPHRTAAQALVARDAALRASVQATLAAARARLAQLDAAPDRGAAERGATFVDSALADNLEGLMPGYSIDAGGGITARLRYGNDAPINLRWTPVPTAAAAVSGPATGHAPVPAATVPPVYTCEVDRIDATRWAPGCAFVAAAETVNPEITYLVSVRSRLRADAARDARYQSARRGTSFGLRVSNAADDFSWVGCLGVPGTRVGDCDAERGDTVCSEGLPLLCVLPDPPAAAADAPTKDPRWLPARLAASRAVRGDELESVAAASARCAAEFGTGWRVASWADRGDGFIARGVLRGQTRAWIDVPGQPAANCWGATR